MFLVYCGIAAVSIPLQQSIMKGKKSIVFQRTDIKN
jgi:hypothetical protein